MTLTPFSLCGLLAGGKGSYEMRSALQKIVFSQFTAEMSTRLPRFALFPASNRLRIWGWAAADGLTFFVGYQPMKDWDQFTVEIAWSENGEFPWTVIGKTSPERPQGRDRLGVLWKKFGLAPVWDLAPEKSLAMNVHLAALARNEVTSFPADLPIEQIVPRVPPLVTDAMDKLEQYGIPLFQNVTRLREIDI